MNAVTDEVLPVDPELAVQLAGVVGRVRRSWDEFARHEVQLGSVIDIWHAAPTLVGHRPLPSAGACEDTTPTVVDRGAARVAVDALRRAQTDELALRGATAVVIAAEWVEYLAWLAADLEDRVNAAVEAERIHWWR
jgi:hypothetical protein